VLTTPTGASVSEIVSERATLLGSTAVLTTAREVGLRRRVQISASRLAGLPAPPDLRPDADRVQGGPRPVQLTALAELVEHGDVQWVEHACLGPFIQQVQPEP
jgi:hypothetical protein